MISTKSICTYAAAVLSLWGCSGGDGNPAPYAEDGITSSVPSENADAGADAATATTTPALSVPSRDACEDEGATSDCMAPVGARAGFVLCAQGERTCSRGQWTTCVSHATSGPVSGWEPASVGCNAPPEACDKYGEWRTCVKQLPPTPEANNCYHGKQFCIDHDWTPCLP